MIRIYCVSLWLIGLGWGMPAGGENPRPVERPSRAVEALRQAAEEKPVEEKPVEEKAGQDAGADGGEGKPDDGKKGERAVFRVNGVEVYGVAREAGWKFFPRGAKGAMDGRETVVEIQPGLPYSMVQGPVLTQRRTLPTWSVISENIFFLFTDGHGRPRSLAPGWVVREVRMSGDEFEWVRRPESGGVSPSMVVRLVGGRRAVDTVVRVDGMILEGPVGARDWREAFGATGGRRK